MSSTAWNWIAAVCLVFLIGLVALSHNAKAQTGDTCSVSVEQVISAEAQAAIKANGGYILELKDKDAVQFQDKVEEALGGKAPFSADYIAIGVLQDEAAGWPVLFATRGCVDTVVRFPSAVIKNLLGLRDAAGRPSGEKVD